jgi:CheY-like chemotaxis protein
MNRKLECVLLVDDDDATNFINRMVVEHAGVAHRTEIVLNGKEALNYLTNKGKYENAEQFPKPELILIDINMPVMDGWDFLEEYHKLKLHTTGQIVIVMLSTSMNPDDKARAEKIPEISGFKEKPLTLELLNEIKEEFFMQ